MGSVRVAGKPYERAALIGQAFAEAIEHSVAFNRQYRATHALDRDRLETLLAPYLYASTASLPHLVEQVRGMADGAGQPFLELFFASAFEEVYGIVELGAPWRPDRAMHRRRAAVTRQHASRQQRAVVRR